MEQPNLDPNPNPLPPNPIGTSGKSWQDIVNAGKQPPPPVAVQDNPVPPPNQSQTIAPPVLASTAAPKTDTDGFPIRKSTAHAFDANGRDIHVGMRVALMGYVTKVDPAAAHFDDVEVTLDHPNPHSQHKTTIKVDPSQLEVL